jgi:hypothetical protein
VKFSEPNIARATPRRSQPPPLDPGDEARKLYRAIFREHAPNVVVQRFLEPAARLEAAEPPPERERYHRAIASIGDLEALEVACRYRNQMPLLSATCRLIVYIAETIPENQRFFVKRRDSLPATLWALAAGAARTAYKLVKGSFLLSRARHA